MRRVHSVEPLILETSLDAVDGDLVPRELHFVRWHGPIPRVDAESYRLVVSGRAGDVVELSLGDVRGMPPRDVVAVLECAGNGRGLSGWTGVEGTPWGLGGVSCSPWTGVPVAALLEGAGLDAGAAEVVFTGAGEPPVRRSLPMSTVLDPDTIVAWAHHGLPLLPEHGAPLRLVVPGWYGMAWTKALLRIDVVTEPWRGAWDSELYALRGPAHPSSPRLTTQAVKAVIARPARGATVRSGEVQVAGFAWSGQGDVRDVSLRVDAGPYVAAELRPRVGRGWTPWRASWHAKRGTHTLRARATDGVGDAQPGEDEVPRNELGYSYNGTVPTTVTVE